MFKGHLKSYQLKGGPLVPNHIPATLRRRPVVLCFAICGEAVVPGLKWLANLHDCGINGILADEMGLGAPSCHYHSLAVDRCWALVTFWLRSGKTVQSTALLAHLAEQKDIWGPFIIVSPSSTLHNWQREISKFCPQFKVCRS